MCIKALHLEFKRSRLKPHFVLDRALKLYLVTSLPVVFGLSSNLMINPLRHNVSVFCSHFCRGLVNIEIKAQCDTTPVGNYMSKVKNRNTRTRCKKRSKLIIKTLKTSRVSIANFEQVNAG